LVGDIPAAVIKELISDALRVSDAVGSATGGKGLIALATDRVFSIANFVFSSIVDYEVTGAGGEMSRDEPDPSDAASANNLAESSYMLADVFFFSLAFAITDYTIDYFYYNVGGAGCSKLTPAFKADRFVADNNSDASSKEDPF